MELDHNQIRSLETIRPLSVNVNVHSLSLDSNLLNRYLTPKKNNIKRTKNKQNQRRKEMKGRESLIFDLLIYTTRDKYVFSVLNWMPNLLLLDKKRMQSSFVLCLLSVFCLSSHIFCTAITPKPRSPYTPSRALRNHSSRTPSPPCYIQDIFKKVYFDFCFVLFCFVFLITLTW